MIFTFGVILFGIALVVAWADTYLFDDKLEDTPFGVAIGLSGLSGVLMVIASLLILAWRHLP